MTIYATAPDPSHVHNPAEDGPREDCDSCADVYADLAVIRATLPATGGAIDPTFSAWVRGIVREELARFLSDDPQPLQALRERQETCTCPDDPICYVHIDAGTMTGIPRF